jgi:hypothetical protein
MAAVQNAQIPFNVANAPFTPQYAAALLHQLQQQQQLHNQQHVLQQQQQHNVPSPSGEKVSF